MSRAPTKQTSSPQWRAMRRLSASEGACPNSSFIIVTGARNSTRAPAVARPVINRINSIWAASMMVLAHLQIEPANAPHGALARDSPLLVVTVLDRRLDLLLCRRLLDSASRIFGHL